MKKAILVFLAAMLVLLALTGCGKANSDTEQSTPASSTDVDAQNSEKPASDPAGAGAGDFGWIRLDIPDGYIYVKEAEYYVTIQNETDSKQFVRIAYDYIMDRTLEQVVLTQISNNTEKYFKGADGAFSGFSWQVINFEQNGQECRMLFCECGDDIHYLRVTAFGLTENDFPLQVILGNISIDPEKM